MNEVVVHPVEAVVVVILALVVAALGGRALHRGLGRLGERTSGRGLSGRTSARIATVAGLVANLWRFAVAVVAVVVLLSIFGVNLTPLLASATVLGATIGFGAQTLVRDYLSGVLLTAENQFDVGDTISVNETTGVVEALSLRVTRLRDAKGLTWYVPNGDIRRLANVSRGWVEAPVDLPVAVATATDLDRARQVLLEAARTLTRRPELLPVCPAPPRVDGVVAARPGACTLRVTVLTTSARAKGVEAALREALVRALMSASLWPVEGVDGDG